MLSVEYLEWQVEDLNRMIRQLKYRLNSPRLEDEPEIKENLQREVELHETVLEGTLKALKITKDGRR